MFVNVIPPGALEILLFLALIGAFAFVVLRVAWRDKYLPDQSGIEDVPSLITPFRTTVRIKRIFRDADSALAEGMLGETRLTFSLTDFASNLQAYRSSLKSSVSMAIYGLATLQAAVAATAGPDVLPTPANAEDRGLELTHSGPFPNDYTIRATVKSLRSAEVDEMAVFVYRFSRAGGLELEAATEAVPGAIPFREGEDVIGTVRLYGYLPQETAPIQ